MKILFLTPYPFNEAASQRFRFEQYYPFLREKHTISVRPFFSPRAHTVFYQSGVPLAGLWHLFAGVARRVALLWSVHHYQVVFIHREAAPVGPPLFEWAIAHIFRKKIIYDFDDAIWLTDKLHESWLERKLRWRGKAASICAWSDVVSCGNEYLAEFARKYARQVIINPTTIDTDTLQPLPRARPNPDFSRSVVVGWTGSHSTLKYLEALEPALQKIERALPQISFSFIADRAPKLQLKRMQFIPWNPNTEAADLARFDIGIMPLPDTPWTRGKCGFKALQYMAMGIPAIVSPVGINRDIVTHGVHGLWAATDSEWVEQISALIDAETRVRMGRAGRQKVVDQFSIKSNLPNFLALFSHPVTVT